MEVQVYDCTQQFAGDTENCRELTKIDNKPPMDPPPQILGEALNDVIENAVSYTNANQGSRKSFTPADLFLKGVNFIERKSLV